METPIIIIQQPTEPDVCPNCGKDEEIIEVCKHCGHVYEEDQSGGTNYLVVFSVIVAIMFLLMTFITWSAKVTINDYAGTYLHYLGQVFVKIWHLMKNIV